MKEPASNKKWVQQTMGVAFVVYLLLMFSYSPIPLSITIHKISVHAFQRYKYENAIQLIFDEQAFTKLRWEIPHKEFAWKGDMYDVIKIENKEGQQVVMCFKDKWEMHLLRLLGNTSRDMGQQFLAHIIQIQLYFEAYSDFAISKAPAQLMGLPEPAEPQPSDFQECISPPPEISASILL